MKARMPMLHRSFATNHRSNNSLRYHPTSHRHVHVTPDGARMDLHKHLPWVDVDIVAVAVGNIVVAVAVAADTSPMLVSVVQGFLVVAAVSVDTSQPALRKE